jgi:hypothetical protein
MICFQISIHFYVLVEYRRGYFTTRHGRLLVHNLKLQSNIMKLDPLALSYSTTGIIHIPWITFISWRSHINKSFVLAIDVRAQSSWGWRISAGHVSSQILWGVNIASHVEPRLILLFCLFLKKVSAAYLIGIHQHHQHVTMSLSLLLQQFILVKCIKSFWIYIL